MTDTVEVSEESIELLKDKHRELLSGITAIVKKEQTEVMNTFNVPNLITNVIGNSSSIYVTVEDGVLNWTNFCDVTISSHRDSSKLGTLVKASNSSGGWNSKEGSSVNEHTLEVLDSILAQITLSKAISKLFIDGEGKALAEEFFANSTLLGRESYKLDTLRREERNNRLISAFAEEDAFTSISKKDLIKILKDRQGTRSVVLGYIRGDNRDEVEVFNDGKSRMSLKAKFSNQFGSAESISTSYLFYFEVNGLYYIKKEA